MRAAKRCGTPVGSSTSSAQASASSGISRSTSRSTPSPGHVPSTVRATCSSSSTSRAAVRAGPWTPGAAKVIVIAVPPPGGACMSIAVVSEAIVGSPGRARRVRARLHPAAVVGDGDDQLVVAGLDRRRDRAGRTPDEGVHDRVGDGLGDREREVHHERLADAVRAGEGADAAADRADAPRLSRELPGGGCGWAGASHTVSGIAVELRVPSGRSQCKGQTSRSVSPVLCRPRRPPCAPPASTRRRARPRRRRGRPKLAAQPPTHRATPGNA